MSNGSSNAKLMLTITASPTVGTFSGRDMVVFVSYAQFVTCTVNIISELMVEST